MHIQVYTGMPCCSLSLHKCTNGYRNQVKIDFYGQLQGCGDTIENANVTWKSKEIAKLGEFILNHEVDMRVCDHVAFDPWQSHKDHKPLGTFELHAPFRSLLKRPPGEPLSGM